MKKIIRLTESDLVRIVKRVINESDPPQKTGGGGPRPTTTKGGGSHEYVDKSKWYKVAVFEDPQATKVLTNIDINPRMIGLVGADVKFEYSIAGRHEIGTGVFYCNSKNKMYFDGKPLTGTLYISDKRVDVLKSKCGASQGYASIGGNTDQTVAESRKRDIRF